MQDIQHSIETTAGGGGGGRLFSAGAGNRHLRPPHNHHHHDLKCPRCDSSNTKFCYYNNYNLSQPRHFCKSCRRYWTNGGVLRNVPVGGGVRKAKRSSAKPKSKTTVSNSSSNSAASSYPLDLGHRFTNSENSSTDSCSRTATATPIATAMAEVSGSNSTNSTPPTTMLNFGVPRSESAIATVGNTSSSEMRTFTGLMRSWKEDQFQKTTENIEMHRDVKMAGNWEENVDDDHEGIFDHEAYWSESQWNDDDHNHLLNYLP